MSEPRVALLDASVGDTPAEANVRRELGLPLEAFKVSEGALPPPASDGEFDAAVLTGSQTSVYWDEPWIDAVRAWAREADGAGLPLLGICWGHQLLADALGGTVEPMGEYELGYRTVERVGDSVLFDGVPRSFVAFETHSDVVTELPPGAVRTAENDLCLQGFQRGATFGVQFHPEYDLETARRVTEGKDLPPERIEAVLAGVTPERHRAARHARRVFENFSRLVERPAPTTTADRLVLSYRSVDAGTEDGEWLLADSDWIQDGLEEPSYRRYLRVVHGGRVFAGEEWVEFVNCGCASPMDVVLRVEALEGGDALGEATEVVVRPRRDVLEDGPAAAVPA